MFADLELERSVAEDLSLADGDAKVFNNDLQAINQWSFENLRETLTSLSADPSIASLWKRLCCAVM